MLMTIVTNKEIQEIMCFTNTLINNKLLYYSNKMEHKKVVHSEKDNNSDHITKKSC